MRVICRLRLALRFLRRWRASRFFALRVYPLLLRLGFSDSGPVFRQVEALAGLSCRLRFTADLAPIPDLRAYLNRQRLVIIFMVSQGIRCSTDLAWLANESAGFQRLCYKLSRQLPLLYRPLI